MSKQKPGVKHQSVEVGRMFGKNPMAGNKKDNKADDKPLPVPKKGSPMTRLANKRI